MATNESKDAHFEPACLERQILLLYLPQTLQCSKYKDIYTSTHVHTTNYFARYLLVRSQDMKKDA